MARSFKMRGIASILTSSGRKRYESQQDMAKDVVSDSPRVQLSEDECDTVQCSEEFLLAERVRPMDQQRLPPLELLREELLNKETQMTELIDETAETARDLYTLDDINGALLYLRKAKTLRHDLKKLEGALRYINSVERDWKRKQARKELAGFPDFEAEVRKMLAQPSFGASLSDDELLWELVP